MHIPHDNVRRNCRTLLSQMLFDFGVARIVSRSTPNLADGVKLTGVTGCVRARAPYNEIKRHVSHRLPC